MLFLFVLSFHGHTECIMRPMKFVNFDIYLLHTLTFILVPIVTHNPKYQQKTENRNVEIKQKNIAFILHNLYEMQSLRPLVKYFLKTNFDGRKEVGYYFADSDAIFWRNGVIKVLQKKNEYHDQGYPYILG